MPAIGLNAALEVTTPGGIVLVGEAAEALALARLASMPVRRVLGLDLAFGQDHTLFTALYQGEFVFAPAGDDTPRPGHWARAARDAAPILNPTYAVLPQTEEPPAARETISTDELRTVLGGYGDGTPAVRFNNEGGFRVEPSQN